MAIHPLFASVRQLFSGRTGTPYSATGNRDYLTRYRVIVRRRDLGPLIVCTAPGLPRPWSFYDNGFEYDSWALLVNLEARPEYQDEWKSWIVDAHYSTQMPAGGPGRGGDSERANKPKSQMNNPEQDHPDIKWSFETIQRTLPRDLNGTPFVNSAGQPFSPPPTFEVAYAVLHIVRNELDFDRIVATRYAYAVNSDVFLGARPGTVQCLPPEAEMLWRGPLQYWRVSYKLRFGPPKAFQRRNAQWRDADGNLVKIPGIVSIPDRVEIDPERVDFNLETLREERRRKYDELEGWQPYILDAGMMERVEGTGDVTRDGELKPIIKMGIPVSSPVLLDGNGKAAKGIPPDPDDPEARPRINPVYLRFRVYQSRPFRRLFRRGFVR